MFHGVIQKITLAQFFETRCRMAYSDSDAELDGTAWQ